MREANRLHFSTGKVFIVSSTLEMARQVQEKLIKRGIKDFVAADRAKDLGVDLLSSSQEGSHCKDRQDLQEQEEACQNTGHG